MAHIPANMRMIENSYQTAARLAVQLQDELQYLKQRPINGDPAYDNAVRLIEQCLADVNGPKDILESPGQSTPAAGAYVERHPITVAEINNARRAIRDVANVVAGNGLLERTWVAPFSPWALRYANPAPMPAPDHRAAPMGGEGMPKMEGSGPGDNELLKAAIGWEEKRIAAIEEEVKKSKGDEFYVRNLEDARKRLAGYKAQLKIISGMSGSGPGQRRGMAQMDDADRARSAMIASQINLVLGLINGVQQARSRAVNPISNAEYVHEMDHYTAELNRLYTQRARELPALHRILKMHGLGMKGGRAPPVSDDSGEGADDSLFAPQNEAIAENLSINGRTEAHVVSTLMKKRGISEAEAKGVLNAQIAALKTHGYSDSDIRSLISNGSAEKSLTGMSSEAFYDWVMQGNGMPHGAGPPRKMTDAEKKAAQALRDKLAKKPRGKESEEELADRARVESELKRKNDLQQTEEGRDQLAAEASAKEDRRQQLAETTDEGLRDITGENRRAKQEMERQANDPLIKAANAIKKVGMKGAEKLLGLVGVDGGDAEKIGGGFDELLSKGKVSDESLDAVKKVATQKLKEEAKKKWDEGVKEKQKQLKETADAKKAAADAKQVAEETAAVAASGGGKPKRTRDEWEDGVDPNAAYYGDYRHPGDEWHRGRNRKARYSSMEGGGLTDYFSKGISSYLPNFANVTNQFVSEGYPRDSLMWLRKNGSEQVRTIRVRRAPVNKNIERALHFISLGQWEEGKKAAGYDSMFHLALIVNGRYTIEKLAKIRLATAIERLPNEEFMDVPITDRLFIGDMLERTETVMGKERYFRYDAFENNCQNFVASILRANNLMTPELNLFVVQPVDELLKKQPGYLQAVSRTLTNLGGIGGAKPC